MAQGSILCYNMYGLSKPLTWTLSLVGSCGKCLFLLLRRPALSFVRRSHLLIHPAHRYDVERRQDDIRVFISNLLKKLSGPVIADFIIGICFIDDSLKLLSVYELFHHFTSSLSKELVTIQCFFSCFRSASIATASEKISTRSFSSFDNAGIDFFNLSITFFLQQIVRSFNHLFLIPRLYINITQANSQ